MFTHNVPLFLKGQVPHNRLSISLCSTYALLSTDAQKLRKHPDISAMILMLS